MQTTKKMHQPEQREGECREVSVPMDVITNVLMIIIKGIKPMTVLEGEL